MKQLFYALAMLTLLFAANSAAQTKITGNSACSLKFQEATSYFVSNQVELQGDTAFLAFTSQADFDQVFGDVYIKGKTLLPKDTFATKFVVAAIKDGAFIRTYTVKNVSSFEGNLYVWYDTTDKNKGSASYRSPLILAVDKANYKKVIFMENGEQAGMLNLN